MKTQRMIWVTALFIASTVFLLVTTAGCGSEKSSTAISLPSPPNTSVTSPTAPLQPDSTREATLTTSASPVPSISPSQLPSQTTKPNIIIDHTNWDWYNNQPQNVIDSVAAQKIFFAHASIGANILQSFSGLYSDNPSKYPLDQVSSGGKPPATTVNGTIYEYDRGNPGWFDKIGSFETYINDGWHYPQVDFVMNKFCAIDQTADWEAYCNSMAKLEMAYPETRFIYFTMPYYTTSDNDNVLRNQFNQNLRNWISQQSDKILFDIADIEAWSPTAVHQTFVISGITYEKLYSGYSSDALHLNLDGGKRVATGLYSIFGEIVARLK